MDSNRYKLNYHTRFKVMFGVSLYFLAMAFASLSIAAECQNWQTLHPDWIFCDDFESNNPIVGTGRYFEYDRDGGDFVVLAHMGLDGSKGMRFRPQPQRLHE